VSARSRAIEELYQMRRLAAFREHLKERLEDTRPAEPPEPLPYAVPFAKFFGQCSPVNAMDREIVDRLQEFTVVTPRLSPARLHRVEHVKCDPPIPLRHSRQHVRLPDAGHAVIRLISDSGIRQKCMPGIPSTQPSLLVITVTDAANLKLNWGLETRLATPRPLLTAFAVGVAEVHPAIRQNRQMSGYDFIA